MRCITVYTADFEAFSELLEDVIHAGLQEDEEKEFNGISVIHAGDVPEHYLQKMIVKPEVVVMRDNDRDLTILQHGSMFEIIMPVGQLTGSVK
jgi:hypothetical protein